MNSVSNGAQNVHAGKETAGGLMSEGSDDYNWEENQWTAVGWSISNKN